MSKKFGDVMQWYLDSMGILGVARSTQKVRYFFGKTLIDELGSMMLTHGHVRKGVRLDRMGVREFRLKKQREGYADATILQFLATGSTAINAAIVEKDWDLPNPFKMAGRGLKANVRHREISPAEQAQGLLRMRQPYRDMAMLIFYSALRPSEVCYLEWERVKDGRIEFKDGLTTQDGGQKSKRGGFAALGKRGQEIVSRQPRNCRWVFQVGGRRVPRVTLYNEFKRAFGAAYSPHDGRHTFGSRARRSLGAIDPVQAQMRHQDRSTTERSYAPVSPELAMLAVNAVDN